jgi:RNA polymerase sigma factor (TIGR02999 family)
VPDASQDAVTALLRSDEDGAALMDQLLPLVYTELRGLAHGYLARERADHTLSTTALVHEAYLKLVDQSQVTARGRTYFFGAAARAMRQILVDYARRRMRLKRGGDRDPVSLSGVQLSVDDFAADLIDLDEALDRLADLDPRQAEVVECRFFGGLTTKETAKVIGVSPRTVKRDWALARAWLYRRLREAPPDA